MNVIRSADSRFVSGTVWRTVQEPEGFRFASSNGFSRVKTFSETLTDANNNGRTCPVPVARKHCLFVLKSRFRASDNRKQRQNGENYVTEAS